ncbi:hypothetical protein GY45DRAFT_370485 [Cubamyces sp. BRFM 1775]|nr:hypothetical protein GY45DRAFT_370485 [Cubamyces sp. BRFM 1775]
MRSATANSGSREETIILHSWLMHAAFNTYPPRPCEHALAAVPHLPLGSGSTLWQKVVALVTGRAARLHGRNSTIERFLQCAASRRARAFHRKGCPDLKHAPWALLDRRYAGWKTEDDEEEGEGDAPGWTSRGRSGRRCSDARDIVHALMPGACIVWPRTHEHGRCYQNAPQVPPERYQVEKRQSQLQGLSVRIAFEGPTGSTARSCGLPEAWVHGRAGRAGGSLNELEKGGAP